MPYSSESIARVTPFWRASFGSGIGIFALAARRSNSVRSLRRLCNCSSTTDGIHWTKYNDTETTDEQFAESDPVFIQDADWEHNKVDRPRVVKSPDEWVMIYQAGTSVEMRGLVISNDGIQWEKYPENPIFNKDVFPIPNAKTWDTNLLHHDGVYYYFMEPGTLGGTDLYLTTHQGSLRQ